ncbi:MAG: SDR family NAD(P)-dependent oxidoreductase, partial [Acidimicrobiales bacterium]
MELTNSSAIITGGASGLGAATARALSERGARVVVFDRNEDGAKQVAGEVGGDYAAGDVTNGEDCQKAVDLAANAGNLRVAVNCAGTGWIGRVINRDGTPHD